MATSKYIKALQTPPKPETVAHMSRPEIVSAMASISDYLKGPLSNTERAMAVLDRNDLRARLAQIDNAP